MQKNKGILTVVSGFSGAGKGTIMKALMQAHSETYALSISATTRAPRTGERDGIEYFFKNFDRGIPFSALNFCERVDTHAGQFRKCPLRYFQHLSALFYCITDFVHKSQFDVILMQI